MCLHRRDYYRCKQNLGDNYQRRIELRLGYTYPVMIIHFDCLGQMITSSRARRISVQKPDVSHCEVFPLSTNTEIN
jgi:hypothetical protein